MSGERTRLRQERSQALQAQPYERSDTRNAHADGFKLKTLATRVEAVARTT